MKKYLNWPWLRMKLRKSQKNFRKNLDEESMDFFLVNLLRMMDLYLFFDRKFRRNIEGFNARYAFKSDNNEIDASVIFQDSKMIVKNYVIEDTDVTVSFRDAKALKNFLFSDSPDIIGAILNTEVSYTGNLNYLARFAYLANHLKYKLSS